MSFFGDFLKNCTHALISRIGPAMQKLPSIRLKKFYLRDWKCRSGCRTVATSKMELFVTIVHGFQLNSLLKQYQTAYVFWILVQSVDDVINIQIYLWSSSQAMADRGQEKKGNKKLEYLENEKRFLDKIKSIFHNFLRTIMWSKRKIVDTSSKP